ncbi:MAG: zinc ribbon domain-containing protein [Anaerolinea sp.]|nr:zinc ribbon domain-containing protein [Anaerolinea sp.]
MPVYTYRCDSCGTEFDHTQRFSDPLLTVCPKCGKETLRKVFTPVSIVFKGSGFYATDHRSPSGASRSSTHAEEKTNTAATEANDGGGSKTAEPTPKPAASPTTESK